MIITKNETQIRVNAPFAFSPMMEERFDLSLEEDKGEDVFEDEFGSYVAHNEEEISPYLPLPIIIDSNDNVATAAHAGDAGVDLTSTKNMTIPAHGVGIVPTGFHLGLMPSDHVALVCSRSGLSTKGVWVANAPGVVDSGYEDEIKAIIYNSTDNNFTVNVGDRIAQVVVARCLPFASNGGARGNGGLGSTGK